MNKMSEAEYRNYQALNFSSLANYYNAGVYSPDHALMKVEYKSYFEYGHQFETMLQDAVKGTNEFEKRFFKSTVSGKMPDDLIKWIDEGEDLETKFVYTKKGDRSETHKTRHAFLDEAMANPGKIPVSTQDWDMLNRHTENMLKMQYLNAKVEDILSAGEWQVPIVWNDGEFEKKALVDCLVDLGGEYLPIDIKTTAGFKQFSYGLRDRYWIQDILYCEGITYVHGPAMQMVFFVASKEAPCLCQPWVIDYDGATKDGVPYRISALETYNDLCRSYSKWVKAGRFPKGWLPLGSVKKFPRN